MGVGGFFTSDQNIPDLGGAGGAGGHEGGRAPQYPRMGYLPGGIPGESGGQGRNEGGMAYERQGATHQDGGNYSGNQSLVWHGKLWLYDYTIILFVITMAVDVHRATQHISYHLKAHAKQCCTRRSSRVCPGETSFTCDGER
jgi:hypothetical protein